MSDIKLKQSAARKSSDERDSYVWKQSGVE